MMLGSDAAVLDYKQVKQPYARADSVLLQDLE